MPQMAPINWFILFIIFSLIFIIFNIMNYYSFMIYQNKDFKKNNYTKLSLNWKW